MVSKNCARLAGGILVGLPLLLALAACASAQLQTPATERVDAPSEQRVSSAGPPVKSVHTAPGMPPAQTEGVMEVTRRSVRSTAEWLARGVDSWFGDKPFEEGGKVNDGRLSVSLLQRQDENTDLRVRFNARFRLPNVEERVYLFIGRDNEREVITDTPGALSRQDRLLAERSEDRSFFAGLGLSVRDALDFRLGFRGGLKPYAQVRYRKPWQLSERNLVEFRETVFWSLDDHLGSTTAFSFEHAYSSTFALRWLNAATVTQQNDKFEWSSILGAYKSLGEQRLLTLEGIVSGRQGADVGVSEYGLQTKWEQPIHKNWLLGEVLVGHFWPRKDALSPRESVWAIGGALKLRF